MNYSSSGLILDPSRLGIDSKPAEHCHVTRGVVSLRGVHVCIE